MSIDQELIDKLAEGHQKPEDVIGKDALKLRSRETELNAARTRYVRGYALRPETEQEFAAAESAATELMAGQEWD